MGLWRYLTGQDEDKPLEREAGAVAPTLTSLITDWQTEMTASPYFSPHLTDRLWVASRCLQLNAQQIASMPLRFTGSPTSLEPSWVSNADPVWYPNGTQDAVFAAVSSYYGWGDAFLYVTARYANGFPSLWTVLDPAVVNVRFDDDTGRREYKSGENELDAGDVVQISRDPKPGQLRGTSALRSYGAQAWSMIAAGIAEQNVVGAGMLPNAVLKSTRKLTETQARAAQDQWVQARQRYGKGIPAVLGPDWDFATMSIDPADLILLEAQEFDARVIATAFGVPSSLLNMAVAGGLTYQNPAMLFETWWRFELMPTAGRIDQALSMQMLPRGSEVMFDPAGSYGPLPGVAGDPGTPVANTPSVAAPNVKPLRPAQEATP
jgi:HK97 family phage portal protein